MKSRTAADTPSVAVRVVHILTLSVHGRNLSTDGFYKAVSYAYLYKSLGERENAIPIREVTLSLFCAHHPRSLFADLRESGGEITQREAGIYTVSGLLGAAAQVIVEGELPPGTHAALRFLLKPPTVEDWTELDRVRETLGDQADWNNYRALIQTSYQANWEFFERIKEERKMNVRERLHKGFPELFEEATQKGIAIGREEGLAEGMEKGMAKGMAKAFSDMVLHMLREHMPVDAIRKFTGIPTDNIMEIARSAGLNPAT